MKMYFHFKNKFLNAKNYFFLFNFFIIKIIFLMSSNGSNDNIKICSYFEPNSIIKKRNNRTKGKKGIKEEASK